MSQCLIFTDKNFQAVRLPVEANFDKHVKRVFVRINGKERVLTPIENTWDSFFLSEEKVTDDFMTERAVQTESIREEL